MESKAIKPIFLMIFSERNWLLSEILFLPKFFKGLPLRAIFQDAKKILAPLDCMQLGGKSLAIKAASNFRFLRSKGITIRKTVDMLIGSWCMEHEIELLHKDRDFDQIAIHLPLKIYAG
jgi:hypothetical protein